MALKESLTTEKVKINNKLISQIIELNLQQLTKRKKVLSHI